MGYIVETLWKHSEHLETVEMEVEELLRFNQFVFEDPEDLEKVESASLDYPIIVLDRIPIILDGYHRLAKAIQLGLKTIKAKRLDLSKVDCDFLVGIPL